MIYLTNEAINKLRCDARSVVRELGLLNDAYFDIGVTLAERHLLIELNVCQSPTMKEIAERLLLDKSTVSRLISKAVKKGYIKCVIDEKDKRKRFIQLTEKGKQTLESFETIAFKQTKGALLTLNNRDIDTIFQGMSLYSNGLKKARLKDKTNLTSLYKDINDKIETLEEISGNLKQLGYILKTFEEKEESGLYEIFQEIVNTGALFPYGCNSLCEFRRQFLNPYGQVYVCQSFAGEVVGGFYIRPNFLGKKDSISNAAYMIRKTDRGKGMGSLIVKASLRLAKNMGFQAMQFNSVFSQNKVAIQLYQKLGFNIIGIIPEALTNSDGSYQDAYIMHRKLHDL